MMLYIKYERLCLTTFPTPRRELKIRLVAGIFDELRVVFDIWSNRVLIIIIIIILFASIAHDT